MRSGERAKRVLCIVALVMIVGLMAMLAGCGNVTLKGDAMTAAQQSTMDAYQAVQRADADPASPAWEKAYLQENFKQWRFYVRSANKDANWGPKLSSETNEGGAK